MEPHILERMHKGLLQQRDNLNKWLQETPLGKKEVLLGPSNEQSVREHLTVIDDAVSRADSGTLGKCEVCHEDVEPELLEVDYTACVCLEHLSDKERRRLENELELAQDVQKMLLPQKVPNIPGLEIDAFSRPAQIVGGDYFDFIDFRNGIHGMAIADVAGHGVSASLHMASVQALLRTLVPVNKSPADAMNQLHKLFIHNIRFETFVTFFLGAFDPSSKKLTYCNAGHQPPLVFRKTRSKEDSIVFLQPTGAAIGLVEDAIFGEDSIELQKEDLLVLYTDGVTEAVNPQNQEFSREGMETLIWKVISMPVKEMVREIRKGIEEFSEGKPLEDDTTIVVCRIT